MRTLIIAPNGLSKAGVSFQRQLARPGSPNRKKPPHLNMQPRSRWHQRAQAPLRFRTEQS